ncbi:DUF1992 domain-containing protein [Brachybacterium nesterenkovii]|uniref:DnaJ family domain-containing protein n=1 Tax=Brachybacterium nesterenkovii TaxID=47847 RepID=UPI00321B8F79
MHAERAEGAAMVIGDPDDAIEAAIARGEFDDLPGAGKPLRLPSRHDPDWWIRQRLEGDDIDRDALLPVVMLLRREHDELPEVLAELRDEQQVRELLEDYNRRVQDDRLRHPMARMLAPTVDVEARLEQWRALERERAVEPVVQTAAAREGRRRRWWRRARD